MLKLLKIRNFALLEDVTIRFDQGLTVVTGETGAGKSMIVEAITTLCGNRMDEVAIRSSKNAAEVTGVFEIHQEIQERLRNSGIDVDNDIIIRRHIERGKRQGTYINDHIVSLNLLSELAVSMVDLIGQYENQSLFHTRNHLQLLDSYAGIDTLKTDYLANYNEYRRLQNQHTMLVESMRQKDEKIDLLTFKIDEIEKANLKADEEKQLMEEKNLLLSSEKRSLLAVEITTYLYETEGSVAEKLGKVKKIIDELCTLDPNLKHCSERLDIMIASADDVYRDISSYASNIEFSQERLDFVLDRLDTINKLKKKYGGTVLEIRNNLDTFKQELAHIEIQDEEIKHTRSKIKAIETRLFDQADELTSKRKRAASSLTKKILALLSQLGMRKARFDVHFTQRDLDETGKDDIEFYMSTNPGEELKPLRMIASGGEISRITLSLKTILSAADRIPTIIFDEVDTGIGGRIAEAVGDLLSRVSAQHQIICVTHLPQISVYADHHLLVQKETKEKETSTKIIELDKNARKLEIARMLGGKEITKKTVEHAEEFLRKVQRT